MQGSWSSLSVSSVLGIKNAPAMSRGAELRFRSDTSAAIAEEAQHEQEQVDEVEVERERAHDGLAADGGAVLLRVEHFLDLLRIPGGEAGEDEHAGSRDHEVEPGALEEHVDHHRDDQADQAH